MNEKNLKQLEKVSTRITNVKSQVHKKYEKLNHLEKREAVGRDMMTSLVDLDHVLDWIQTSIKNGKKW